MRIVSTFAAFPNIMRVLAYTHTADVHCIACVQNDFKHGRLHRNASHPNAPAEGNDENGLPYCLEDREGNLIHPVFSTDDNAEGLYCGDCLACIVEPVKPEVARISFSAMWTDALGEAIKARALEPYPVEMHNGSEDLQAIAAAVNQGIDSHLEAVQFAESAGSHGRRRFVFEPASVAVLVRRLMESGEENAESLASGICETLGIELI